MEKFKEPVWMERLDKYFWPILFILGVLTVATISESFAQEKVTIEKWRLELACKELILFDSLKKDYAQKDSLISDMKKLEQTRLSQISNYQGWLKEKNIQLDLSQATSNNLIRENLIWKKRFRRRGFVVIGVSAAAVGLIALK